MNIGEEKREESGTFFDPGDFELAYQKAFDSVALLRRVLTPFLFFSGKLGKREKGYC